MQTLRPRPTDAILNLPFKCILKDPCTHGSRGALGYSDQLCIPPGTLGDIWGRCRPSKDGDAVHVRHATGIWRAEAREALSTPQGPSPFCGMKNHPAQNVNRTKDEMPQARGQASCLPSPRPPTLWGLKSTLCSPEVFSHFHPHPFNVEVPKPTLRQTPWPSQPHCVSAVRAPAGNPAQGPGVPEKQIMTHIFLKHHQPAACERK